MAQLKNFIARNSHRTKSLQIAQPHHNNKNRSTISTNAWVSVDHSKDLGRKCKRFVYRFMEGLFDERTCKNGKILKEEPIYFEVGFVDWDLCSRSKQKWLFKTKQKIFYVLLYVPKNSSMTAILTHKNAIKLTKQKSPKSIKRPESTIKKITNSAACKILVYELNGQHRQKLKTISTTYRINSDRFIYFPKQTQRKLNANFLLFQAGGRLGGFKIQICPLLLFALIIISSFHLQLWNYQYTKYSITISQFGRG